MNASNSEDSPWNRGRFIVVVAGFVALMVFLVTAFFVLTRRDREDAGEPGPAPSTPMETYAPRPQPTDSTPTAANTIGDDAGVGPVEQRFEFTVVLNNGETEMSEDSEKMVAAAEAFLKVKHERDYDKPYPGYDLDRLVALSDGTMLRIAEEEQRAYAHPRSKDVEAYNNTKRRAGGKYVQTLNIRGAWVNPSQNVTMIIDTKNPLGQQEIEGQSFAMNMVSCASNDYGWCVGEYRRTTDQ